MLCGTVHSLNSKWIEDDFKLKVKEVALKERSVMYIVLNDLVFVTDLMVISLFLLGAVLDIFT